MSIVATTAVAGPPPVSRADRGRREPVILAGVSGSAASSAALRWAQAEARHRHGALKALLVWTPRQHAHYAPAGRRDPVRDRDQAARSLAAVLRSVLGPGPDAQACGELVDGTAERALVEQSLGADLLVLGSAAGTAAGRPIGPVIRTCLRAAHCPVVIVGPDMQADLGARAGARLLAEVVSGG